MTAPRFCPWISLKNPCEFLGATADGVRFNFECGRNQQSVAKISQIIMAKPLPLDKMTDISLIHLIETCQLACGKINGTDGPKL